jgi:hypothetical protein
MEDCKEEIKQMTAWRMYEISKASMANVDDLAELPLLLAGLTADLAKEILAI